jgi:hypothetical protein
VHLAPRRNRLASTPRSARPRAIASSGSPRRAARSAYTSRP